MDADADVVLMAEVTAEATYVKHHKQKIALVFSAMRHFAAELESEGVRVVYVKLDDPKNSGAIASELDRAIKEIDPEKVVLTAPGEWRLAKIFDAFRDAASLPVEILDDNRFFADHARFQAWADGRKALRMEYFYRELRRETGFLMDGEDPEGGQWNFDADNRKSLPDNVDPPAPLSFEPDAITRSALELVENTFPDHFGRLDRFGWAINREQALQALDDFVDKRLPRFGDFQDAMSETSAYVFHSLLSPYINIGLLSPREVCEAAEAAYQAGDAPLNAVEGFIRQILGWREYVRGVYWLKMPDYKQANALQAERPLPSFYWTAETDMNCLANAISATRENAYAHHIQRLMLTGNFALLAGIDPKAVSDWYLAVYADAFEWVETPNTLGMALFADGGLLASKPYAASGAYIDRMSDHCKSCAYDVKKKAGETACPFNYLYWDFLMRNEKALCSNQRLRFPYKNLERFGPERRAEIAKDAKRFLDALS